MAVTQCRGVGLAHRPEIPHQLPGIGIIDGDAVAIDDRQSEAGALQQAGEIARIGERRDARAGTILDLAFGFEQRDAQRPERLSGEEIDEQQPVRLQDVAQLQQRAGQIVDPVKGEAAGDEIEARRREGQGFEIDGERAIFASDG